MQVVDYLQHQSDELSRSRGVGNKFQSVSSLRTAMMKVQMSTWTCFKPDDCHNPNRQKATCYRNLLCTQAVRHVAREGPRLDCEDPDEAAANPIADELNFNCVREYVHTHIMQCMHHIHDIITYVTTYTGRYHHRCMQRSWIKKRGVNPTQKKGMYIDTICMMHIKAQEMFVPIVFVQIVFVGDAYQSASAKEGDAAHAYWCQYIDF